MPESIEVRIVPLIAVAERVRSSASADGPIMTLSG
jgi:hypothetical protein